VQRHDLGVTRGHVVEVLRAGRFGNIIAAVGSVIAIDAGG